MKIIPLAFALALTLPFAANAQESERTLAIQFALSHPVDNAEVVRRPQLGDSVPTHVDLRNVEGNAHFGYFYYAGQPVIVDLRTRAVVRLPE